MENCENQTSSNDSNPLINTIGGKKFTNREIDVLACILEGRAAATRIASLLSVGTRAVEHYSHNIRVKLNCNAVEGIKDFLENCEQSAFLKSHYSDLIFQKTFEQELKKFPAQIPQEIHVCSLIYWPGKKSDATMRSRLEKQLKLAGIKVMSEAHKDVCTLEVLRDEVNTFSNNPRLFVLPQDLKKNLQTTLKIVPISQEEPTNSDGISILLVQQKKKLFINFSGMQACRRRDQKNNYLSLVEILKSVFPAHNFEDLLSIIKEQYKKSSDILDSSQQKSSSSALIPKKTVWHLWSKIWCCINNKLVYGGLALFLILLVGIRYFHYPVHNSLIRSDLILPTESLLLNRPDIISQIDHSFKGQAGIQTIALVGPGGAGKTTLARQFARRQKSSVVWEINAETQESLFSSFESLAQALVRTEEEGKILRGLQNIKNAQEKKEKIISFVKDKLRSHMNWILIYDNVEQSADIQMYFPNDPDIWGRGNIIITTRNTNIKNSSYVNNIIKIEELNYEDTLNLFMKIINNGDMYQLNSRQTEQAKEFLRDIPPFPLDISIAAYYLQTTNISYVQYLEYLRNNNKDFDIVQKNILKETSDYTKTRYQIITLSIRRLMDTHKDFADLFLFISLLDSQNIPRALLDIYKGKVVVDDFIYNLKKYSLITNQSANFSHS